MFNTRAGSGVNNREKGVQLNIVNAKDNSES